MARVSLLGVNDVAPPTETIDPVPTTESRPGRHRAPQPVTESPQPPRRTQRPRRERPAFASSAGGRAFRVGLCLASLIGLAYATVVVLGLLGGGDEEPFGLPTRHSGEGGQVTTVAPLAVEPENEAFRSASPSTSSAPSAPVSGSAAPSPVGGAPSGAADATPPADAAAEEPAAEAPADDEPQPTPSAESDDDEGDKLIDVNLLGIRISI